MTERNKEDTGPDQIAEDLLGSRHDIVLPSVEAIKEMIAQAGIRATQLCEDEKRKQYRPSISLTDWRADF